MQKAGNPPMNKKESTDELRKNLFEDEVFILDDRLPEYPEKAETKEEAQ
jgi:hypothetical protein